MKKCEYMETYGTRAYVETRKIKGGWSEEYHVQQMFECKKELPKWRPLRRYQAHITYVGVDGDKYSLWSLSKAKWSEAKKNAFELIDQKATGYKREGSRLAKVISLERHMYRRNIDHIIAKYKFAEHDDIAGALGSIGASPEYIVRFTRPS